MALLHEEKCDDRRIEGGDIPPQMGSLSRPGRVQFLIFLAGIILFTIAATTVVMAIDHHMIILIMLITTSGAAGGLLYAMREGAIEVPQLLSTGFRPGWVGDALFGIAGAHAIFLLIPNFSENSLRSALEWTTSEVEKSDGADILEVIAVGLVAGFAGRSVLKRASDGLLKEKIQHVEGIQDEQKLELAEARRRLAEAEADTEALTLTVRQMNAVMANPEREQLRHLIRQASPNGRTRIFDAVQTRYQTDPDKNAVSIRAIPVLDWLLEVEHFELEHKAYALVADIYGASGNSERAKAMYEKALASISTAPPAPNILPCIRSHEA